jgi:hypothetical protein
MGILSNIERALQAGDEIIVEQLRKKALNWMKTAFVGRLPLSGMKFENNCWNFILDPRVNALTMWIDREVIIESKNDVEKLIPDYVGFKFPESVTNKSVYIDIMSKHEDKNSGIIQWEAVTFCDKYTVISDNCRIVFV